MTDRKIKHKGTTNKPAPQGHDYEINILTLSYLDAMEKLRKNRDNFHSYIATEVLDTSPFEDVVYVQVQNCEATSYYVQAKHSLQKFPIKLEELLSDSTKRDKISLTKYFESVRNIKQALKEPNSYYSEIQKRTKFCKESHKFIIFTNRPLHDDVISVEDTTDDVLFYTKEKRKGKLYKIRIDDNNEESVYKKIKALLNAKVKDAAENEINEFCNDLIFATEQPNVHMLKQLVEEKLKEITNLPDTKWIANTLDKELSQWAHQKDGWFLDRNSELFKYIDQHLASWKQTVCTLNNIDTITEQGISFKNTIQVVHEATCFLNQIVTDEPQVYVVYYEHLKLTEIKIAQAITDKIKYETVFLYLEDHNMSNSVKLLNILKAFESGGSNFLLIIVKSNLEVDETIRNIISNFFDILEKHSNKKIILIVPSNFSIEKMTERTTVRLKVIKDGENSLIHLNEVSQDKILNRSLLFEKHRIKLQLLVDENLQEKIYGQLLADLIRGDIVIKTKLAMDKFELKNVQDYYIPRRLKRICIQKKILNKEHELDFFIYTGTEHNFEPEILVNKDIILITENNDSSFYNQISERYKSHNIHWLTEECNKLYWHKSQGSVDKIRNYVQIYTYNNDDINTTRKVDSFKPLTDQVIKMNQIQTRIIPLADQIIKMTSNQVATDNETHYETDNEESNHSMSSISSISSFLDSSISDISIDQIDSIQDIENKTVVISAEPGMGKSTLLSQFHNVVKSSVEYKEQTLLVVKTNLESHSTQFKKLHKRKVTPEDAIEFLIESINFEFGNNNVTQGQENDKLLSIDEKSKLVLCPHKDINGQKVLCLKLFAYFYNENKMIVLLDGFDETAPKYSSQVLGLLEVLRSTNIRKLIVTTRPCGVASELERSLHTLSYSLNSFSEEDQLKFLNKFWTHKLNLNEEIDDIKLEYFLKKCDNICFEDYSTTSNNDYTVFVSIPQHIEMVATVYMKYFQKFLETGECEDLTKDLNLYSLYNIFFQAKFSILHDDVSNSDKCKEIIKYGKLRKITKKEHGQLAMIELFKENNLGKIISDERKSELIETVQTAEEKTGIVYLDRNGEPRFVHRTFAEFFAADLLADLLLLKDTKNHKQYETAQHLLYELFNEVQSPLKVVITFLNYKLVSECSYNECNECSVCKYRDYFIAALNKDWKKVTEVKDIICNIRDPLDRTPLHLGLYSATSLTFTTFLFENQFERELYTKDTLFNWTPIHYFAMNNNHEQFRDLINLPLCTVVIDNPELLQDIYGKTPLMCAKETKSTAVALFAKEIRIAHHLKDHNGNTSLHYITDKSKDTPDPTINKNNSILRAHIPPQYIRHSHSCQCFSIDEIIITFLVAGSNFFEPNIRGVTPCMQMLSDSNYCEILYMILMNKPKIKSYIAEIDDDISHVEWKNKWEYNLTQNAKLQDSKGKTILHHSIVSDKLFGLGLTECFLRYQAVVDGINIQDHEGKTVLHHALSDDQESRCFREIPCLMRYGADVTISDNDGNTPIEMLFNKICTIEFNRDEEFEIFKSVPLDLIIALCQRQCKPEQNEFMEFKTNHWRSMKVRNFINTFDRNGRTVTHYAVLSGNIEKMSRLLKYKPNVNIEDNEGKIPADAIFEDVDLLEMLDGQPSLREQLRSLLLSMSRTKVNLDKLLLTLGRYKNIAYYLIENNAINVNRNYGGETLYNILNKQKC